MKLDQSKTIEKACSLVASGDLDAADRVLCDTYPFEPISKSSRSYTPRQVTKIFLRDGFIDRYKGTKLVYPPALRVLSHYLPKSFPYHKNGRMDAGHIAYWELFPTIDHIVPVARGGADSEENWVCCSMLTNSIKGSWTLEQLGWDLKKPGSLESWDGMIAWFLERVESDKTLINLPYFKTWFCAAAQALE